MLVELLIHAGHIDLHVGVGLAHGLDALGGSQDVHELNVLAAVVLHKVDGSHSGTAGSQHGVQHDDIPVGDVAGHLAVVLHGVQGLRVPVQADVTHLGGGDQGQDAVHHTQTGAEDGHDGQLLASQLLKGTGSHRGLDLHILQGEVPGGLVALQGGDLRDDLPEFLHAGLLVPQDAQLMLKQGMVQNMYFAVKHIQYPFLLCSSRANRSRSAWDRRW